MQEKPVPDFGLLPRLVSHSSRLHIRTLAQFLQLADDVTDNPSLSREEKLARLSRMEAVLDGHREALWSAQAQRVATDLQASLSSCGAPADDLRHVLQAFRRDARGHTCHSWHDLMLYCQLAAAPVGRHILHVLQEDVQVCGASADALSAALRILRQLRDCEDPTVQFNRLCIPRQYLDDALITPKHLRAPSAKGQTRAVLDRVLDGVDRLLDTARPLPRLVRGRGLAVHMAILYCHARTLVRLFRQRDPLRERVGLSPLQRTICLVLGTLRGLLRC